MREVYAVCRESSSAWSDGWIGRHGRSTVSIRMQLARLASKRYILPCFLLLDFPSFPLTCVHAILLLG